jgi:hypothetical protein
MRPIKFIVNAVFAVASFTAFGQESARTVQYHSQDIVAIRAKVKYTTLIEVPPSEKIMEGEKHHNIYVRRNSLFARASRDCFAAFPLVEVPLLDVGGCRSPPRVKGVERCSPGSKYVTSTQSSSWPKS